MINSLRNFGLAGNSRVLPDIGVLSRNYQKISNLNFSQPFRNLRALACEIQCPVMVFLAPDSVFDVQTVKFQP